MQLPTEITKPKVKLEEYIILLYGEPKIGKSTFASRFDKPLFLATEAGLNALETYQLRITSWEEFLQACRLISEQKHDYKTIVIDTIDNLAKFCSHYICGKQKIDDESDLGYGKAYKLVKNEFLRAITKLSQLPYGLIMISHAKTEEVKTRTKTLNKIMPTVDKSFRQIVLGLADMILFAHTQEYVDKETGEIKQLRLLSTKPTELYEAGDRTGKLPETLDFKFKAFNESWNNINQQKEETKGA